VTVTRTKIETSQAPSPAGPYSQGIRTGNLVFLAGQGPNRSDGSFPDGFEAQAEQALQNLQAVARAAGAELSSAVRVGVYLRDMANFGAWNEVYTRYFSEPLPARTTIQSDLPFSVEIDAVLELPS
jgi:2-iminobutanoate/2-iminopropanoate deaminase